MTTRKTFRSTIGLLLAIFTGPSVALDPPQFSEPVRAADQSQSENIAFDPVSGNFILTYETEDELRPRGMYQTIYVPPNKINPTVKSLFKTIPAGGFGYRYTLKSGKDSQQNIVSFGLLVTSAKGASISTVAPTHLRSGNPTEAALALSADARKVLMDTPEGWNGYVLPNVRGTGLNIDWSPNRKHTTYGLAAGKSQSGFGYESEDLPGIGLAGMRGRAPTLAFAGDGLSESLGDKFNEIRKKTSGVTRPVAVPTFVVPNPFDASALLARFQKHANVDLVRFKLIDPTFATQLDPWFAAAIDAAKRGNTEGVRYQLKELRKLLKQEHADVDKEDEGDEFEDEKKPKQAGRIDRLAARVLDFDLKYVEKRLEEKK